MTRRATDDRGSMTAFVAIIAVALVMVAGMVYDGGQVISATAQARSDAAKAARAGAQEVDLTTLRSTSETVLDPARAEASALAYLAEAGATGTVTVDGPNVTVRVTINQPMQILPLPDRSVVAAETATALDEATP
jgi:Flp pilus assembly protein TadG